MRGQLYEALFIGTVLVIVLLGTAQWWGPLVGRVLKNTWRNLTIAGDSIFRTLRRIVGQGQTRPTPKTRRDW